MYPSARFILPAALLFFGACSQSTDTTSSTPETETVNAGEVNVYSARHYDADLIIYDKFTEETGIEVNLLEASADQLIQRIQTEGELSPADVLITVDAGRLWRAVDRGAFQQLNAPELSARIPAHLQDADDQWIGVTGRARVIVYNKDEGLPEGLATYADLADPRFEGEVCMRSSGNIYNISLMASIISREGEEVGENWARGIVSNLARPPQGNDTALLRAIAAGECGMGVANTYYIARLAVSENEADRAVYEKIGIVFPNQETTGTHVNLTGIGITAHAPNRENGLALIDFLTRKDIQGQFSSGNNEYPLVIGVEPAPQVKALGEFKADDLPTIELGRHQEAAVRAFDRAGWN